ncbi:MAG: chloramphenicol acetyltransferase [Pseudomonadota bacterium]
MPKLSPDSPHVHADCEISDTEFGAFNEVGKGTRLRNVIFGDYSYCDRYSDISNTVIGKFSNIASFTRIGPTDHPMHLASQHHFLYRTSYYWHDDADWKAFFDHRTSRITHIGHDTWIGAQALVMPEVRVGTGAVVAAGAVVTKDVDPYTIVGGVPAKPIKRRFDKHVADQLQALAWWDWDRGALRKALPDMRALPAEAFVEKYQN